MVKKFFKKVIKRVSNPAPIVPVVRLEGVIAGSSRYQEALNLQSVGQFLQKAFEMDKAKAVAVIVNSPGGSPTHSVLVHDRIRHLAQKHDKKVYVFVEEVAASGGYWIACAGDVIYALPSSIVGSIGVISASFGFDQAIEKLGVTRRVHTSGLNKSFMDPFLAEKPKDVKRLKDLQSNLHDQFRTHVQNRRGEALTGKAEDLFSGAFWLGEAAQDLGLIDHLGDVRTVLEEEYGEDVKLPVLQKSKGWLREFLDMRLGLFNPARWAAAVEYRAVWAATLARYGL